MTNKNKYIDLCNKEDSIPLFSQYWWLDAVCGAENWDVLLYENDNKILGSLPFYKKKNIFFKLITIPLMTQNIGPWIKYESNLTGSSSKITFENKVMSYFISNLPKFDYCIQNFHYSLTNWLPFYWSGYNSSVGYTYVIPDISDSNHVFENFSTNLRRDIKMASKSLRFIEENDYKSFYDFHVKCLIEKGQKISYTLDLFKSIYSEAKQKNQGCIFSAIDEKGNKHASLFVVWDNNSAYHLITPIDTSFKSNALKFLTFEAIKRLSKVTKSYDFEGSMIPNVEASYRLYGTVQKPYIQVTKVNSKLLKVYTLFKSLL